jgi:hypothetical protein
MLEFPHSRLELMKRKIVKLCVHYHHRYRHTSILVTRIGRETVFFLRPRFSCTLMLMEADKDRPSVVKYARLSQY